MAFWSPRCPGPGYLLLQSSDYPGTLSWRIPAPSHMHDLGFSRRLHILLIAYQMSHSHCSIFLLGISSQDLHRAGSILLNSPLIFAARALDHLFILNFSHVRYCYVRLECLDIVCSEAHSHTERILESLFLWARSHFQKYDPTDKLAGISQRAYCIVLRNCTCCSGCGSGTSTDRTVDHILWSIVRINHCATGLQMYFSIYF